MKAVASPSDGPATIRLLHTVKVFLDRRVLDDQGWCTYSVRHGGPSGLHT